MIDFEPILQAATARAGGTDALNARLPVAKTAAALRSTPDDRYLAMMSLRIFQAGLKHDLVAAKWPAFEQVFFGFDPPRVRAMPDDALEALMADRRLIRHWGKIKAVRHNAAALADVSAENGGFGAWLAERPSSRIVGLWADLAKRFSNLGGKSGPYFLRMAGKDTFILTDAVVAALNRWGAFDGTPKSQRERDRVQTIFNAWSQATGRALGELSMILALSAD